MEASTTSSRWLALDSKRATTNPTLTEERSSGFTKASKQDNEQGDQTLLDGDSVLQRAWCHLVASKTSNCLGRRSWVHRESLLNEILLCLERQLPWRYLQVFLAALGIVLRYRSTRNKPRQEATPCLLGWHVGDSELLFALCVLPGLNVYEVGVARTHHAPRGEDPPPASPRRWSKECFSTEAAMAPNVSPAWLQGGADLGAHHQQLGQVHLQEMVVLGYSRLRRRRHYLEAEFRAPTPRRGG